MLPGLIEGKKRHILLTIHSFLDLRLRRFQSITTSDCTCDTLYICCMTWVCYRTNCCETFLWFLDVSNYMLFSESSLNISGYCDFNEVCWGCSVLPQSSALAVLLCNVEYRLFYYFVIAS